MPNYKHRRRNGNSKEKYDKPEFDSRTGRTIYHLSDAPHNSRGEIYLRLEEGGPVYRAKMIRGRPFFTRDLPAEAVRRRFSVLER